MSDAAGRRQSLRDLAVLRRRGRDRIASDLSIERGSASDAASEGADAVAASATGSAAMATSGATCAATSRARARASTRITADTGARRRRAIRGASRSPISPTTSPCVLDDARVERAVLVGHSMGVQVALETYRRHRARVAGLVLVCGAPSHPLRTFRGSAHARGAAAEIQRWIAARAGRGQPVTRVAAADAARLRGRGRLEIRRELVEPADFMPYLEGMARIDARAVRRDAGRGRPALGRGSAAATSRCRRSSSRAGATASRRPSAAARWRRRSRAPSCWRSRTRRTPRRSSDPRSRRRRRCATSCRRRSTHRVRRT